MDMREIGYHWITEDELAKVAEIDRTEQVHVGYKVEEGRLVELAVNWDVPRFRTEGAGEHTVAHQIEFCLGHLRAGGQMIGAFDGETLVGIGVITPEIRPKLAQLAYLQVSQQYRRQGIAARLTREMIEWAKGKGAEAIYVSATPSGSAVGFYTNQGFRVVGTPLTELFDLEPEDIHMIRQL
jgi:ribosomal protein S18 acetylase RimI-like enzyme